MKYKVFGLLSVFALLLISSAFADPGTVTIEAWTDKASYQPGDRGTLHITIKNTEERAITIHNLTVEFPWYSSIQGEGNVTKVIDEALKVDETYYIEVEFSVPNDGRALWGSMAYINVMTDVRPWPYSVSATIPVALPTTSPSTNNLIIILIAIVVVASCIFGIMALSFRKNLP